MQIAMIGLGRMGANMAARLLKGGHDVVVFDRKLPKVQAAESLGARGTTALAEVATMLERPRVAWQMITAGDPTHQVMLAVAEQFETGDIIVDGGNSYYKDTLRRGAELAPRGIELVDAGTSGGVWGLEQGYSLMVGGADEAVRQLTPALQSLAPGPDIGWGHVGPRGAGHFTKMVHNGIEYGLMQAYAEGFQLLAAKPELVRDIAQLAEVWRYGSVVRSWLLDLTAEALADNPKLEGIAPWVEDSGEGRWTVQEAIDLAVPAPAIAMSLMMRFRSREESSFAAKLLAAMRQQFGGHAVRSAGR